MFGETTMQAPEQLEKILRQAQGAEPKITPHELGTAIRTLLPELAPTERRAAIEALLGDYQQQPRALRNELLYGIETVANSFESEEDQGAIYGILLENAVSEQEYWPRDFAENGLKGVQNALPQVQDALQARARDYRQRFRAEILAYERRHGNKGTFEEEIRCANQELAQGRAKIEGKFAEEREDLKHKRTRVKERMKEFRTTHAVSANFAAHRSTYQGKEIPTEVRDLARHILQSEEEIKSKTEKIDLVVDQQFQWTHGDVVKNNKRRERDLAHWNHCLSTLDFLDRVESYTH